MKILIDADGCPVVKMTIELAIKRNIQVIIISDTCHIFDFEYDNVHVITVSKGQDSADFILLNKTEENDIVITQDYGLASMCLLKKAIPINQNGFIYTENNIDDMLLKRYISKKIRNAGGKTNNIKKRNKNDDEKFRNSLSNMLK